MRTGEHKTARLPGPARGFAAIDHERPTGELFSELIEQAQRLVREEIHLARYEIRDEVKQATRGGALYGAAGVVGHAAFLVLSFCLVAALATQMPVWAGALIVAVLLAACAAALAATGRKKMKQVNVKPSEAIESLREDKRWAQETRRNIPSRAHADA